MVNGVTQAIARYTNSDTSLGAFHRLESSLQACVGLHDANYDFALDNPDPSNLEDQRPRVEPPVSRKICGDGIRRRSGTSISRTDCEHRPADDHWSHQV